MHLNQYLFAGNGTLLFSFFFLPQIELAASVFFFVKEDNLFNLFVNVIY